jgi:hypothetical protein
VNSAHDSDEVKNQYQTEAQVMTLDVTSIALDLLGHQLLSAPVAGFTLQAAALAPWNQVAEAVQIELTAIGLGEDLIARNLQATYNAYHAAPSVRPASPYLFCRGSPAASRLPPSRPRRPRRCVPPRDGACIGR